MSWAVALMRAGKALCNGPALGLHYGEANDMSQISVAGPIANAAANMRDALLKELENSKALRGCVEALLIPNLHTGNANMQTIATQLGMSRQALFRKLKTEDTSFEKVLDGLRHTLAVQYLGGKKVLVNEAAYLAGFPIRHLFPALSNAGQGKARAHG